MSVPLRAEAQHYTVRHWRRVGETTYGLRPSVAGVENCTGMSVPLHTGVDNYAGMSVPVRTGVENYTGVSVPACTGV